MERARDWRNPALLKTLTGIAQGRVERVESIVFPLYQLKLVCARQEISSSNVLFLQDSGIVCPFFELFFKVATFSLNGEQ